MTSGHKHTYLTALVLGCALLCALVLGLRWHALAQRETAPEALPRRSFRGAAGSAALPGGASASVDQAAAGAVPRQDTPADGTAAATGDTVADADSELSATQLRRLAEGGAAGLASADADRAAESQYRSSSGQNGGSKGSAGSKPGSTARGLKAADPPAVKFPVDLNRVSRLQLEAVPGIGPVLAQRIIDYRKAHGPFSSLEQLDEVKGIGPKTLERLRKYFYLEKVQAQH